MEKELKEYINGEIAVTYDVDLCIHAGECVKGSPKVFQPKERPWIQPENSGSAEIMATIDACPSKALKYRKL